MTAELTYEMRGGSLDLLKARDKLVLIAGAAGTGKSQAGLLKIFARAVANPGSRQLLLRQTHASLTASTLVSWENQIAAAAMARGDVTWFGGSGRKPPGYSFSNGSFLAVGGLDQPGKLLSTEYMAITVDEADQVSAGAVDVLTTRLRQNVPGYKQIVLMCNPASPEHYLYQWALEGKLRLITSVHEDNPYLFGRDGNPTVAGEDYLGILKGLTGVRRDRYLLGRWVAAEGMVYPDWLASDNVVDWFPVPRDWPLYLTVDFGFNDAFVCQWWRVGPDGALYLTREIHKSQVLVEDHARHIRSIMEENAATEPPPTAVICDHQLEDRKTLERHLRLPTIPARKAIGRGVQLMQSRVRAGGDGKRRLYVFRDAVIDRDPYAEARHTPRGLAAEISGYVWQTLRGTDGIPRETPKDAANHSLDAARYMVAHLDWYEDAGVGNPAAAASSAAPGRPGSKWGRPVGR